FFSFHVPDRLPPSPKPPHRSTRASRRRLLVKPRTPRPSSVLLWFPYPNSTSPPAKSSHSCRATRRTARPLTASNRAEAHSHPDLPPASRAPNNNSSADAGFSRLSRLIPQPTQPRPARRSTSTRPRVPDRLDTRTCCSDRATPTRHLNSHHPNQL